MGNQNNTPSKIQPVEIYDLVDDIATNYILTMDFQSLKNMSNPEYCNKLLALTTDIINKKFNQHEIELIGKRIENGVLAESRSSENILYSLNNEFSPDKKTQICQEISKFYVIISNIFASIVMTINPTYSYKNEKNETIKLNLYQKNEIPENVTVQTEHVNICSERISSLNGSVENAVSPSVCSINVKNDGSVKTLLDEPGIPELMHLYFDNNYDYLTGNFNSMNDETKKQYDADLKLFYSTFTGNTEIPETVKEFKDIKLKDYNKKCVNGEFKNTYVGNSGLFKEYAENIARMVKSANNKQAELLDILNILFTFVVDDTNAKKIKINPSLTTVTLQQAVKKTRNIIIELYVNCEKDYVKGIEIYEAIINKIGFQTLINQQHFLENEILTLKSTDPLI
jgi:hypothetical protein